MPHHTKTTVEESFSLALQDADLQNVAVSAGELALDSLLDEGLLRDVPILGTLVKVISASATIADRLFLKKLLTFLLKLQDVSPEERARVIADIDNSKEYRTKVGEKLLYIVDTCEDSEIAELVGRVFKYFLQGQINYAEFLKTASVLQRLNIPDFKWFTKARESHYFDLSDTGDLMHTGLFELYYEDVRVDVVERERESKKIISSAQVPFRTVVDGGAGVNLSRAGEIILEVFCYSYKKKAHIKL